MGHIALKGVLPCQALERGVEYWGMANMREYQDEHYKSSKSFDTVFLYWYISMHEINDYDLNPL